MDTPARRHAIGGYHELELGSRRTELHPGARRFQSARAAFLALLLHDGPRRIWIPWYMCETMVDQARIARVPVVRYGLEEDFTVSREVELEPGDWLLYVNYFGLCDGNVDDVLRRFPAHQVIIDNSHALFAPPRDCLGTIYSPRKFVGAPDGGLLLTGRAVPLPVSEDTASVWRCVPLLLRLADCAEAGYPEYLKSQQSLVEQMPLRMSQLTRALLAAVDYEEVARRRRANFARLQALLGDMNRWPAKPGDGAVPLGYPVLAGSPELRRTLIASRVYVPCFWPHLVEAGSEVPAFERHLARSCIPLPCDQRYGEEDMTEVAGIVSRHFQD
jgi:hypothetical protein